MSGWSPPSWPNGQFGTLIRALIGGAQPNHGWWAPVAQRYKEEVGAGALSTRFTWAAVFPTYILTLVRSRGSAVSDGKRHRLRHCHWIAPPLHRRPAFSTPPRRHCSTRHRRHGGLFLLQGRWSATSAPLSLFLVPRHSSCSRTLYPE
jgi:hypothetical protein